jgi:hypothetical protein
LIQPNSYASLFWRAGACRKSFSNSARGVPPAAGYRVHPDLRTPGYCRIRLDVFKCCAYVPMQLCGIEPFVRGQIGVKFAKTFVELTNCADTIAAEAVIEPDRDVNERLQE